VRRLAAVLGLVTILAGVPAALVGTLGPPRIPSFSGAGGLTGSYVPIEAVLAILGITAWAVWAYAALAVLVNLAAEIAAVGGREPGALLAASVRVTPRALRGLVKVALGGLLFATLARGLEIPNASHSAAATVAIDETRPVSAKQSPNGHAKRETYRVRSGDSLWRIAEQELGSGFRWRRIFELNRGREFPHGRLTDPRWIEPGWVLELPRQDDDRKPGGQVNPPAAGDSPSQTPIPEPLETVDVSPSPRASDPASPAGSSISESPAPEEEDRSSKPEAEPEPPKPVLQLPSGLVLAASFASGLLSAHVLAKLRERRSRLLSSPQPVVTPEPRLVTDVRHAGTSPIAANLDVALDAVARAWRDCVDRWPLITLAVESERQVTVVLRDDGVRVLPPTSGGTISPLIRFSRDERLVRAHVSGPFPTMLRSLATPLQLGLTAPLGYAEDGSAVHYGLMAGGPLSVRGSSSADLLRQMTVAVASHASPDNLEVFLLGTPPQLEDLRTLPQVTRSYSWEEASVPLRELQGEFVRRSRLFSEGGVDDVWDHLAHHPEERLSAALIISAEPPPALRSTVEGVGQQSPLVGAGFIALGWEAQGSQLLATAEEKELRTDLPGFGVLRPLLLTQAVAREAIETIQRAHPKPDVSEAEAGAEEAAENDSEREASIVETAPADIEGDSDVGSYPVEIVTPTGGLAPPPETVAIRCLGPLEVSRGTRVLRKGWRTKSLELLAYLVANPGGASRDRIVEELWPEIDPQQGNELFYVVTSAIRGRLRAGDDLTPYVEKQGEVYCLQDGEWWIDVWEFEENVKAARRSVASPAATEKLRSAIELYQGEFCAEKYYPWAEPVRERLRALFVQTSAYLADSLSNLGEHEEALSVLEGAIEADPISEDLCRRAMAMDASLGRRSAALTRYRKLEATLDRDLAVEPDPETQALARQLLRQGAAVSG
jgi:DNA-binding SARP family transcriptional activator